RRRNSIAWLCKPCRVRRRLSTRGRSGDRRVVTHSGVGNNVLVSLLHTSGQVSGCRICGPHDTIPRWAIPLAFPFLLRPSPPPRLSPGTLPSFALLTGSPPCAFLPCFSAELKL